MPAGAQPRVLLVTDLAYQARGRRYCDEDIQLAARLREGYPYISLASDSAAWVEDVALDESGRVASVTVCGQEIPGTEMRTLFELRSTAFTLSSTRTVYSPNRPSS